MFTGFTQCLDTDETILIYEIELNEDVILNECFVLWTSPSTSISFP